MQNLKKISQAIKIKKIMILTKYQNSNRYVNKLGHKFKKKYLNG